MLFTDLTRLLTMLIRCLGSWVVMIHALMTTRKLITTELMFRKHSTLVTVSTSKTGAFASRVLYCVLIHSIKSCCITSINLSSHVAI